MRSKQVGQQPPGHFGYFTAWTSWATCFSLKGDADKAKELWTEI